MCRQAGVRRAGFYRWRHAPPAVDADLELRDQIQRIALDSPCYGWRRVTAELRRQGYTVNHRRVRRIMREDNLLCLRRKKCVVTTDSNHDRPVYPNLARSMVVTHTNQLCVANITYIRLESGFVYLAVSGTSSSVFITRGVCIQRWATARRRSLNECWLSGQMGCTDGLF
jgi:transposase InsO family protein